MTTSSLKERRHERIEDAVAGEIARAIRTLSPDGGRLLDIQPRHAGQTLLFRDQLASPACPVIYDERDERDSALRSATDFWLIDVEAAAFPGADGQFDLAIWNRELVTVKNVGPALREVRRVLQPGGMLVIAVPNLAALHNRMLLLAGRQPSTLHIGNGDHIRGFAVPSMTRYLQRDLGFEILEITGVGLAPITGAVLPGLLRGLSHSVIWILRKHEVEQVARSRLSEDTAVKTSMRLADGRELVYFGSTPERPADYPDLRSLTPAQVSSQQRYDPLLDEWVVVASHRRNRAFHPGADQCPLCPSTATNQTEIPAPAYDVVVLENRFPALGPPHGTADPDQVTAQEADQWTDSPLPRPAVGRCEVVCFSQDHEASFADLTRDHVAIVVEAWIDRSIELSLLPWVKQVYCFENRGREIGVTLSHPHGQIYAYPFVTPRTSRMLSACAAFRQRTGKNLFDQVLAAERANGSRIVLAGEHWVAFVPYALRWALGIQFYPAHRVPDLASLPEAAKAEFCELYLDVLRRFDRLFDAPVPYVSALHQAPVREGRDEFALHIELFSVQRAPGRLQHLAGSELGMGVFATDVVAETVAESLRQHG